MFKKLLLKKVFRNGSSWGTEVEWRGKYMAPEKLTVFLNQSGDYM